jgi:adhesin transport system outer membrane protein
MERRVEQEVSPLADLQLARSRAAQIEQEYTVIRAQRQSALRIMAELVADPDYNLGPVPFYDPSKDLVNRDSLSDEAKAYDPTLRRLDAQINVARADRDAAKASVFPRLSGQYAYSNFLGSRVGVVASLQTAPGLSSFSEIQSAGLRVDAALESYRQAEQALGREVDNVVVDYEASRARASVSRDASDTAQSVAESYVRQFIAGRRSWLDVMNSLREALTARVAQSDAEYTAMSDAVRLLLLSGRWQPSFSGKAQQP